MVLRVIDLYWTAGFLEGEGTFALCGSDARVTAPQVQREPLERLKALYGGAIYPKKPSSQNGQPGHVWYVGGATGAGLMMTLYPLMSPKRQHEIWKALTFWHSKGARFGALHYNSVASDEEALAIMRRVKAGESMYALEKELGISHTTMSMWMRGTKRPNLRQLLEGKDAAPPIPHNKGAGHRLSRHSDDEALEIMRAIRSGRKTVYGAAKESGLKWNSINDWLKGTNRPYLLARVLEEEEQQAVGGSSTGDTLPLFSGATP